MSFLRQSFTIAGKDLRSELRSKETINATLSFAVVILLLFSFAFEPTSEQIEQLTGGLLWLVFAFAATLVINRSFARDLPNDCLDALIASPISGAALFFGKAIANFVLLLAVELISLPIYGLFYNVAWTRQFWPLMLVVFLTTWGLAIYHVAMRNRQEDRTRWLLVVVLANLFGAWFYWLHKRNEQEDPVALAPR